MTAIGERSSIFAVALVILLAGCSGPASGGPVNSDDPTGTSTSTSTSTSEPDVVTLADTVPVPFVDLQCSDLVPLSIATAAIKIPIVAQSAVLSQGYLLTDGLPSVHEPMTFATRQAGGFSCEWSNGEAEVLDVAQNPAYAGFTLDVLPNAAANWANHTAYLATFGGATSYCTKDSSSSQCSLEELVDGTWYWVQAFDVTGATDAAVLAVGQGIVDAASASVAAATATTTTAKPFPDTTPLTKDCNQFFTAAELNTLSGMNLSLAAPVDKSQIGSLGGAAEIAADVNYCSWFKTGDPDQFYDMALMSWMQGGEWAFTQIENGGGFENATPLAVAGLGAGEKAYVECIDDRCGLDILVSHDWVWFSINLNPAWSPVTSTAAVASAAAQIVAKIG